MKVRQPSLQSVLIVTGATAVISFLSIYNYVPRVGFFWNILHGEIYIDAPCPTSALDTLVAGHCGDVVPYRWVLVGLVAIIAVTLIAMRRNPK